MEVLVVDDSKAIRKLVAEIVDALGHQVSYAENGVEALAFVQSHDIDLILMDVEMPGMNGFETTQKIRELKQDDWFPIVFITSKVDDESTTQGISAGADAYLTKPISPLRLQLQIIAMERIYATREKLKKAQQELLSVNKQLTKMAMFDELTGLANRRNFNETMAKEYRLANREKNPLSLILGDIDFFKSYNDNYGHQQGDKCLAIVAEAIRASLARPSDLACRYGGEEFVIILPNTGLQGATLIAEKIRQAVWDTEIQSCIDENPSRITLSLGLATYTGQYKSMEKITKAADEALYRAKEQGRNCVEIA